MEGNFKFYNIGQGCFYGGAIKHNNEKFVIVYDCGSITKGNPLKLAIDKFKKEYNHIDLLIISHFDSDHVNGIEDLIKGIRVERIILPYMPLWYRIALIANTSGENTGYNNMLINPTNFFLNGDFNVGELYYVDQASKGEFDIDTNSQNDPDFETEFNPEENLGTISLDLLIEDKPNKQKILNQESDLNDQNVSFLSAGFNMILRLKFPFWEFLFYHRETRNQSDVKDFKKAVEDFMKVEGIIKSEELFSIKRRTILKKLYIDHISTNINYSSLCVYHGPKFKTKITGDLNEILSSKMTSIYNLHRIYRTEFMLKGGTLLTGDQFLKTSKDFGAFYKFYRNKLDKILFFQVPHHGSLNNWKMMPNELNHFNIGYYVINCGYGRKKHPHKNVLYNILRNTNCFIVNDEFNMVTYKILPK